MEKVLYIYGYESNPNDSSTMKEIKKVTDELGYELISIEYSQENPNNGLNTLESFIRDNKIKYVIGHSLGGFMALCIDEDVKKIVINPCMNPHIELPKLGKIDSNTLHEYEYLEGWLKSGDETPWVRQTEDVIGLFGEYDELFSYYNSFKKIYPRAYYIKSYHQPKYESFTKEIKEKIKEFFN